MAEAEDRILDLPGRVDRLTGPCRETDREILFATFPKERTAIFDGVKHISTMTGRDGEPWFNPLADRRDCPYYTGSFRATKSLLPNGCTFALGDCNEDDSPWACVTNAEGVDYAATGADPVLAFLSAILRARAALVA